MKRIEVWTFAVKIAAARPIIGGGFRVSYDDDLVRKYLPDASRGRNLHSIYFEVLAEHGYVGLVLFLVLGAVTLRNGTWIKRATRDRPDLVWANDLASMTQVGIIGFAFAGLFQNLAFFDLYYQLIAIMCLTRILVEKSLEQEKSAVPEKVKKDIYALTH
jgi:probable O-glycosylation ligase (exosortase A-associated)